MNLILRTYRCFLDGREHAGGLDDILGTDLRPRNRLRFAFAENGNLISIDNEVVIFGLDFSLELAVGRVILEHVDHVIETDERIIDGDDLVDRDLELVNRSRFDLIYKLVAFQGTWAPRSKEALSTRRPIRPNPLIPTLLMSSS